MSKPETTGHIGFTGTRRGMTPAQKEAVADRVRRFQWLHHGDCLGADREASDIAVACGVKTHGHPPLDPRWRAYCSADAFSLPADYIDRNHDIVRATEELIAAPAEMQERLRSGTWATIRYAKRWHRLVTIVYPDGSLEFNS